MRERLFIQFNGDEPVQCQLTDTEGKAAAGRYRGGLADMISFAENRQVIVIVPADDVLYFQAEVPRAATTRLRQAIPYLLEDNLLEPVEHYHFALGRRGEQGKVPVAVLPLALVSDWQSRLYESGLHPAIMVTDILCLPWQAGEWSFYLEEEKVRLRYGAEEGLLTEWANLPALGTALLEKAGRPERVSVYAEDPEALEQGLAALQALFGESADVAWESRAAGLFDLCIQHYSSDHAINLLQGPFKFRRQFNRQLGPWRMAATLAAGLLLLWIVDYGLGYWRLSHELDWLDAQINEEIHTGFPEIKTIRQPLNQVNVVMGQLRGQAGSSTYSRLIRATGRALQTNPGTLQEINYRNRRLVVDLHFVDLQAVNGFEQALRAQKAGEVKVLSANKKDSYVQARVQINGGGS